MIKALISIILYLAIIITLLQNWLGLTAVLIVLFSWRQGAGTLLPLAIVIDGYFGNFYTIPWLSLWSVCWYGLVFYLRPKIVNLRIMESYG